MIRILPTTPEPPAGSVVIRDGLSGTVYQRFHGDGCWHSVAGDVVGWEYFTSRANPSLAGDWLLLVGVARRPEDLEGVVQWALKHDPLAAGYAALGAPKLALARAQRVARGEVTA